MVSRIPTASRAVTTQTQITAPRLITRKIVSPSQTTRPSHIPDAQRNMHIASSHNIPSSHISRSAIIPRQAGLLTWVRSWFGFNYREKNPLFAHAQTAIKNNDYNNFITTLLPYYKKNVNTLENVITTDEQGNQITIQQTVLDLFLNELMKTNLAKSYAEQYTTPQLTSTEILTDYTNDIFIIVEELLKNGATMASQNSYDEAVKNFEIIIQNVQATGKNWNIFIQQMLTLFYRLGKAYYNRETLENKLNYIEKLISIQQRSAQQAEL